MQPASAFVVVCSILAMHIPSPAESADVTNGLADQLFQFLETLENGTILYTIKRSYEKNIQATTGTKTITCIEATVMYAEKSSAGLCTIFKTREENATAPFVATYQRTGPETILGEPGKYLLSQKQI
ncbi:uncharacterized protein LOC120842712 [Ixodes scapularis]|uniref:uncharacterized protein LOC120842712 n=1 Tax=Ixodes scapularis TaxID=6945 RepID=UPI001C383B83|nr:uncharacterized protein LOC120842712 [Ixodes scapularis]